MADERTHQLAIGERAQPAEKPMFVTDGDLVADLRQHEQDLRLLTQGLDHLEAVVPTMRRQATAISEDIAATREKLERAA